MIPFESAAASASATSMLISKSLSTSSGLPEIKRFREAPSTNSIQKGAAALLLKCLEGCRRSGDSASKAFQSLIPASCSFHWVPSHKAATRFGSSSPRFWGAPEKWGRKRRNFHIKNRVELMGFLGKNPESKTTKKSGRKLTILSLATKTWWTDKNEERHDKTEWHRIIVWNGLADYAADKLKKGDHLYVVGTLVSNAYEKDVGKGKSKAKIEIMSWQVKAFSIRKLDRKDTAPATPSEAAAQAHAQPEEEPPF
jgi:single-strand DNA-binding protein